MEDLSKLATDREISIFSKDFNYCHTKISKDLTGSRILLVGGAGSIGAATVSLLLSFSPSALHVIDISENGLAELVRDLRSSSKPLNLDSLECWPIDYGSELMKKFLQAADSYDYVFNFAALKHVRSERDIYSLLQMLDTNLVKHFHFINWLKKYGHAKKYR